MTTILILSAGTRNLVVRGFRRTLEGRGRVVATDMNPLAPAIYEADTHYIVPRMTDPSYLDVILGICKDEHADGVLSLIDPELSLLAAHESDFAAVGTRVIGSSYELCEMSLDKMSMFHWLSLHGYRCAKSWDDPAAFEAAIEAEEVAFPVFMKPVRGSASIAVSRCEDLDTAQFLWSRSKGLMAQEYLDGQEYGADVYVDMISGEVVSIFLKKKLRMRAGETDKAVSVLDDKLFELVERLATEAGYRGQIDVDLFEVDGEWYVSEVNPRFGGGYPHAFACGVDHMSLIVENLNGRCNERHIGTYERGVYMMKYSEEIVLDDESLLS